jgi:signal transduction histidine kinase
MKLHVGLSAAEDVELAASEAVGMGLRDATTPAFALVLCTDSYDAARLAVAVNRALGSIPWAGCCTAGVFAGAQLLEQGVVCGVFSTEHAKFGVGLGGPLSIDPRGGGRSAAAQAVRALDGARRGAARTFIVLPDALTGNASEVVRGAVQAAGAGAVWAGGGAGDNLRFVRSAQFAFGECWRDRVVVIAIDAPHPIAVGIKHGWHPYGPAVTVTRATGVTANELDYESAFLAYRRTAASRGDSLDERGFAPFAMRHPLGIPQTNGEFVIRDPLAIEADGSLRCVAEVPDGAIVRVMEGDTVDLLAAAREAAVAARLGLDGAPGGAIVFDCVSRSLVLGPTVRDELVALQDGIGRGVPLMGCLTLGEVGALGMAAPQFHNKTSVVMALPIIEATPEEAEVAERRPPAELELHADPLAIASVLQELTVAALDLFDPKRSTEPFLDRVAERLGCYAALLLDTDDHGALYLAGANGLATESRLLPFARGSARDLADVGLAFTLPYPEVASAKLVRWIFPIGSTGSSATMLLFFYAEPRLSPQLRGMLDRLTRILATVLDHRRLFARTYESERRLAEERDAVAAARAAAERANEAKDEFLAVVSHEIRNRLNPVLQWTRLLRSQELPADRVPHALEVIERNSVLQSRLIEDLLDLDRAASGTFQLTRREIDLGTLVVEEAEVVGLGAAKKRVALHVTAPGEPALISGDTDRMRQLIANLLENAVKFTPAGGRVEATVSRDASMVRLRVEDSGRGIPPELLPRIFDLFRRGGPIPTDPPAGSRGSGLGIGLALVRRIAETHGGTVRAESAGVDRGATFTVELPAAV